MSRIRPLQTPEIRGRKLSGRYQISGNGQHLVDGVPFGRALLRKPNRPRITIPARKRALLVDDGLDESLLKDESEQPYLITNGEDMDHFATARASRANKRRRIDTIYDADGDESDSEEDDGDFDPDAVDGESDDESLEQNSEIDRLEEEAEEVEELIDNFQDEIGQLEAEIQAKTVPRKEEIALEREMSLESLSPATKAADAKLSWDQLLRKVGRSLRGVSSGSSSDESSEEESAEEDDKVTSSDSSSDEDDEDEEEDADFDSESESSDDSDSDSTSDSSSDSSAESDDEGPEVIKEIHMPLPVTNATISTTSNKSANSSATTKADSANDEVVKKQISPPGQGKTSTQNRNARRRNAKRLQNLVNEGILPPGSTTEDLRAYEASGNVPTNIKATQASKDKEEAEFQEQRAKLLASLGSGGVDMYTLEPVDASTGEMLNDSKKRSLEEAEASSPSQAIKRARLDVASTRRMVLGSLGIRASKASTGVEKPSSRSVLNDSHSVDDVPPESDAWKGKLRVTAVECLNEGVTLIPPPYPFVQRWDPSQQNGKSKKKKKSGRKNYGQEEYQAHDDSIFNIDPDESAYPDLNYDEEAVEDTKNPTSILDDLPELPENPNMLQNALLSDFMPGAVIAFKQYDVGANTNWQPIISEYRTVRIVKRTGEANEFESILANRDIPYKNILYDDLGNRVPSRFNVNDDDEDDEDDGFRVICFDELITPKLVAAALPEGVEPAVPCSSLDVPAEEGQQIGAQNSFDVIAETSPHEEPFDHSTQEDGSEDESEAEEAKDVEADLETAFQGTAQ